MMALYLITRAMRRSFQHVTVSSLTARQDGGHEVCRSGSGTAERKLKHCGMSQAGDAGRRGDTFYFGHKRVLANYTSVERSRSGDLKLAQPHVKEASQEL
jgi:hypothetical protein